MNYTHIAHVIIKNYRNFEMLDIDTSEKTIDYSENATGKTNYIKALQLVLDTSLSEQDRMLTIEDFPKTHCNPMENGEEIVIKIFITNYKSNPALMCILADSVVNFKKEQFAKITLNSNQ